MRTAHGFLFAILAVTATTSTLSAAPWLTFSEVHYRPHADAALEFVEIYNLDAPSVDLRGWRLTGAVAFEFARGTRIGPRECLVVVRDVAAFRKKYPDVKNVVGPLVGELGDDGGRVNIRNRLDALAASLRWGRDGSWDVLADGTGRSLVLSDAVLDPRQAESWVASEKRGGSPGTFETSYKRVPGTPVLSRGVEWKFFRGTQAPPASWFAPDFDDSKWETGKSGFGFGDNDDETELLDMAGNYLSVFTRREIEIEDPNKLGELGLLADYDDGFVAFLNGREIARANLGPAGSPVVFDQPATGSREAGRPETIRLGRADEVLRAGRNVLAVAGFNLDTRSSDMSLIIELESRAIVESQEVVSAAGVRINEVAGSRNDAGLSVSWIELWSKDAKTIALDALFVTDDPAAPEKWKLAGDRQDEKDGFRLVSLQGPKRSAVGETLYLYSKSASRFLDALSLREDDGFTRTDGFVQGRFPDGSNGTRLLSEATPSAVNLLERASDLAISEICYHPIDDAPAAEFLEIYNRGKTPASLKGITLRDGIEFEFSADTSLAPGSYLVVAKDPTALAKTRGLPASHVVGPYRGRLRNSGERITLRDERGRVLDLVEYSDRSPWPSAADGWGPSLELQDTSIGNGVAGAWQASDEAAKSKWQEIEYRAGAYVFPRMAPSSFQFMLLDEGECLIDDVRIVDEKDRPVVNDDFAASTTKWRAFGTHGASRLENGVYRIVAKGRGNSRHNYVSLSVDPAFEVDAKYTVSFRVRWLSGSPLLLSRTSGQGLAKTHQLATPEHGGTPGRANSRATTSGPIVGTPKQSPVAPSTKDSVRFDIELAGRGSIVTKAELRYRHQGAESWSTVPLKPIRSASNDRLRGEIPPQPKGRVEFAIVVEDSDGRQGTFPKLGTEQPAQYAVGLEVNPAFPTYTVLISDDEWAKAQRRERMSNQLMDATLVYGKSHIFYNVGFRARGSGFTRGSRNWRLVFGTERLGEFSQLTFDGQGRDFAKANERAVFWLLDQADVPTPRQRYIHLSLPDHPEESGVYEDVEKINGDYLTRWFPKPETGVVKPDRLHKIDDYWDFGPPAPRDPNEDRFGGRQRFGGFRGFGSRNASYVEAFLEYETSDPEDYRWNFPPRSNGRLEDFSPLVELIRTADPGKTKDDEFREKVAGLIDVDEWASVIAARTLANDWDTYGLSRGKNAYLYRNPSGRWSLLPWDSDLSWGGRGGFGARFGGFGGERPLVSTKFAAIERLFSIPKYRRGLYSHLAFLATKRMDEKTFSQMIRELGAVVGTRADHLIDTALDQRERILGTLPRTELTVESTSRVARDGKPHLLKIRGTAPILAADLRLGDLRGTVVFPDEKTFEATFEIDANIDASQQMRAVDRDEDTVARIDVTVPAK